MLRIEKIEHDERLVRSGLSLQYPESSSSQGASFPYPHQYPMINKIDFHANDPLYNTKDSFSVACEA